MIRSGPLFLLLALSTPLLAINAGPEIPLGIPANEPSALTRSGPRIASNGSGFLAVWYDELTGGIRGARLDQNGTLVDATSFPIADRTGRYVSVASDGLDYVVAYACTDNTYQPKTCLAHVLSSNGRVMPGATIDSAAYPVIASSGRSYVLVVQRPDRGNYLDAMEVSGDASAVAIPFHIAGNVLDPAAITSDGKRYFVIWSSYDHLYGSMISEREVVRSRQQMTTVNPGSGASAFGWSVASNGNGFMVTWQQNLGVENRAYATELRTRSVGSDGTAGVERTIITEPERTWYPVVCWNGSAYEIAYTAGPVNMWPNYFTPREADIHRTEVTESGEPAAGPSAVTSRAGRESMTAIASNGHTTVIVWERQNRRGAVEVEASAGGDPFIVSNSVAWQESIAGTLIAGRAVLAWQERVGPLQRQEIRLQRLDPNGVTLEGRGIVVEPSANDQLSPALSPAFIAWIEQGTSVTSDALAVARRLDNEGRPFGPLIQLGTAAPDARISVASTATESLIVWQSAATPIAGIRMSNSGLPLDPLPFPVSPGKQLEWNPVVTTDGTDYLVTWQLLEPQRCFFECVPPSSLHSVVVRHDGSVGQPAEIAPAQASRPLVAWNGSEYVIFWLGADIDGREQVEKIKARRVDRNGVPFYGLPRTFGQYGWPRGVAWDGSGYLLAFDAFVDGPPRFSIARIDAELIWIENTPLAPAYRWLTPAALLPRDEALTFVAYETAGVDGVSRAVARLVGPSVVTARRRSTRR